MRVGGIVFSLRDLVLFSSKVHIGAVARATPVGRTAKVAYRRPNRCSIDCGMFAGVTTTTGDEGPTAEAGSNL